MKYAPLLITAYNRPEHLNQCLESLLSNDGAVHTDLYVFIDAPYREEDNASNTEVKIIASRVVGFKSINIIHREYNLGPQLNSLLAWNQLFGKYDRVIRTEEDNIFSKDFLKYINLGLEKYEHNKEVMTICGYSEPFNESREQMLVERMYHSAWGFGIWKDRYYQVDFHCKGFLMNYFSFKEWRRFNKMIGDNIYIGLVMAFLKRTYYADFSIIYHMYINNMVSIFPTKTLVRNIGQDNSGLNSGYDSTLQNQMIFGISDDEVVFDCSVSIPKRAGGEFILYNRVGLLKRVSAYFVSINIYYLKRLVSR
jgi:hypothetical protein